jgi:DNA-binding IclR family transcriptional regulator
MLADPDDDFRDVAKSTAIQKAVRLMQAIAAANEPQQLAELAEHIGMPKPTVHRLLSQLEEVGVVGRDLGGKGYTVGATWLQLAIDALTVRARQPVVHGIMRKLVDQVQESCNLGVLQDHEVLYLERVECDWPLRMQLHAGSRVPMHCTASGKLLLAQMNAKTRQRLLAGLHLRKYTSNTLTDPDQLEKEFETIRNSGIAINKEEYHLGLIGVAVPIRRSDQTVVATLSIHAPSFRMSVETALSYVPLLQKSASEIAIETNL